MNYRHAFHAGNFADVFKHALLARILTLLQEKETPFRYIDTHAGVGLYNLGWEEARAGIILVEWPERLGTLAPPDALHVTLAPGPHEDARIATLIGWEGRL